jgi:hypothetical protein
LTYDGSQRESILSRKDGIYKIYNNIFLNDTNLFINKITDILEDLYDNNSVSIFKLYFMLSIDNKDLREFKKYNIVDLNKHLSQYSPHILSDNISKVYKNTGLLLGANVMVFDSNYNIDNLRKISSSILNEIQTNIPIINENILWEQENTIINFTRGVRPEDEIMLLISANFHEKMNEDMLKWNSFLSRMRIK